MDDLYFEKELRKREKERVIDIIEKNRNYFISSDNLSSITKQVIQNFDEILFRYYSRILEDTKEENEIWEMVDAFIEEFSDDKLKEMYKTHEFSDEESDYINLCEISSEWRDLKNMTFGAYKYAIIDVLLRAKIIGQFGEESLDIFRDIIEKEISKIPGYYSTRKHYNQLLSDKPFGENNHEKLENKIEQKTSLLFNDLINCGGYALKIDRCVFPTGQENSSQSISSLLDKFPFVRLLGDKPLEDDEYLVIYRTYEGRNRGHHFIRVDSDGIVREKDGNGEPRIFENWRNLSNGIEALFAVKKEHEMFGYDLLELETNNNGLDFEETVEKAIKEKHNLFSYHDHEFNLKKSKQDEIFVTTKEGEIVGEVLVDDDECIVELKDGKESYVENISGFATPIIQDGKLINLDDFKQKNIKKEEPEERE